MCQRRVAALVFAAVALLTMPAIALADAELASATPTPGSTVDVAPTELVATFTATLDGAKSSLEVRDSAGATVVRGSDILGTDGVTMTLALPALDNGTYEVRWTAAATDSHITRGTYEFTLAVAPSPSPSPSRSSAPSAAASPKPSAAPSQTPLASPAASASPSSSGGGGAGGADGGLDLATVVPIVAALVVVGVLAVWFARKRTQ